MVDGVVFLLANIAQQVHIVAGFMQPGLGPNSSDNEVLQARLLEWVEHRFALNFSVEKSFGMVEVKLHSAIFCCLFARLVRVLCDFCPVLLTVALALLVSGAGVDPLGNITTKNEFAFVVFCPLSSIAVDLGQ